MRYYDPEPIYLSEGECTVRMEEYEDGAWVMTKDADGLLEEIQQLRRREVGYLSELADYARTVQRLRREFDLLNGKYIEIQRQESAGRK